MGNTKGVTAQNYVDFIRRRATPLQLQAILAELDESLRRSFFELPILAMSYVDYGDLVAVLLIADRILGDNDQKLLYEASKQNQRKNINGIYKALLPFASPELVIKRASKLWERYHDTGQLSADRVASHKVRLTLRGYPNIPEHHGPEIEGAFDGLVELTKSKVDAIVHTKCVNRNDPVCEWEISWQ